jgi:hypothetical protein
MRFILCILFICLLQQSFGQGGCYKGGQGDGAAAATYLIQPLRNTIRSVSEMPFKIVDRKCIISGTAESGQIQLFNPLGQLIFETNCSPQQIIDLPSSAPTLSILRIRLPSQTYSKIISW